MGNEECVTICYHGNEYDSAIDRELKRRGLNPSDVTGICLPNSMEIMGISPPHTRKNK